MPRIRGKVPSSKGSKMEEDSRIEEEGKTWPAQAPLAYNNAA
jgi:hypothetical protein